MKTPREILLQRHQAAGPRLDEVRRETLRTELRRAPESVLTSWHEFLRSFRGHFAALGAAWVLVLLLHADVEPASSPAASATGAVLSPQLHLAKVRENRRQLLETIGARDPEPPQPAPPRPHSERRRQFLTV